MGFAMERVTEADNDFEEVPQVELFQANHGFCSRATRDHSQGD